MIIVNLYKDKLNQQTENPNSSRLSYKELIKSKRYWTTDYLYYLVRIQKTRYNPFSPNKKKKKNRSLTVDEVGDFDKNVIKRKIHSFRLYCRIPTLKKIVTAVNEDDSLPNLKQTSLH